MNPFQKSILLLLPFVSHFALGFNSSAGGIDAGGGDAYAAEFVGLAHQLVDMATELEHSPVDADQLKAAILETEIQTLDRVFLNGIEKDAINYPSRQLIELSRSRWDDIKDDVVRRYRLVLHEYLGILKINDEDYQISSKFLSSLRKPLATISCHFANPLNSNDRTLYRVTGTTYSNYPAVVRGFVPSQIGGRLSTNKAFFRTDIKTKGIGSILEAAFANEHATFVIGKDQLHLFRGSLPMKTSNAKCSGRVLNLR
jgi:hypothetical protein